MISCQPIVKKPINKTNNQLTDSLVTDYQNQTKPTIRTQMQHAKRPPTRLPSYKKKPNLFGGTPNDSFSLQNVDYKTKTNHGNKIPITVSRNNFMVSASRENSKKQTSTQKKCFRPPIHLSLRPPIFLPRIMRPNPITNNNHNRHTKIQIRPPLRLPRLF